MTTMMVMNDIDDAVGVLVYMYLFLLIHRFKFPISFSTHVSCDLH